MTTKRTNPRKDFTQVALSVVKRAAGEAATPVDSEKQASGRKGGLKGGAARASKLTPEQRVEIAKRAAQKRWASAATEPAAAGQAPSQRKAKVAV